MKKLPILTAGVLACVLAISGCATSKTSDGGHDSVGDTHATTADKHDAKYAVPRHPLMLTRAGGPRTSLAVAAKDSVDLALSINREASMSYKRYSNAGKPTGSSARLEDALELSSPRTREIVQLSNGSSLHRSDTAIKISDAVPMQTLMLFLKRVERSPYLTASEVKFQTTSRWWGVCESRTKLVVSSWFASGPVSLPETQVHMPKVSATRIAYALVAGMRSGELKSVSVGPKGFKASGVAKSAEALDDYTTKLQSAHRCIRSVDVDSKMGLGTSVAFQLEGRLKCRTR